MDHYGEWDTMETLKLSQEVEVFKFHIKFLILMYPPFQLAMGILYF